MHQMPNTKIVVIDDERSVQDVVSAYLQKDGFTVFVAGSGSEGLALAERMRPALIVLDLMLPDVSGETVCSEIRSRSDVPILMLTAKAGEDDRVAGLLSGADDYLVKPFSPRELVARVRAVLRRSQGAEVPLVPVLSFDDGRLQIDTQQYTVRRNGEVVDLTPNEYRLLTALATYPGRAYSRLELVDRVQGYDFAGDERTIDVHVKNLRKKIEPDPSRPTYVQTVTGVGYRLAKL
jgi:DNA-binding response OmpR family regulator